ncbi:MAG: hypothetical protein OEO23_07800 [Gemmatimonadota bacterium]|nr:hypothetical protein [Gemmatimonadota bacterium]
MSTRSRGGPGAGEASAVRPPTAAEEIRRFESDAVSPGAFRHADHVRMAWNYLMEMPLNQALPRYAGGLLRLATRAGRPDRYHETITWAFMFVIRERMLTGAAGDFDAFRARNPDLFEWPGGALADYYSPERLESEAARQAFLMPDRVNRRTG